MNVSVLMRPDSCGFGLGCYNSAAALLWTYGLMKHNRRRPISLRTVLEFRHHNNLYTIKYYLADGNYFCYLLRVKLVFTFVANLHG